MTKLTRKYFAFALIATMAVVSMASAAPVSHELSASAQGSIVGAASFACDFAGGASLALGVATLFGCAICGPGSLILAAGAWLMC